MKNYLLSLAKLSYSGYREQIKNCLNHPLICFSYNTNWRSFDLIPDIVSTVLFSNLISDKIIIIHVFYMLYTARDAQFFPQTHTKHGYDHAFICVFCITREFMQLFRKEKAYKKSVLVQKYMLLHAESSYFTLQSSDKNLFQPTFICFFA